MRRPENQQTVIGTLMGTVSGSKIDIQSNFAVPVSVKSDQSIEFDSEYATKMLKFQREVNPKEALIGFYQTGTSVNDLTMLLQDYYAKQLKEKKNKSQLVKPLIMLIDPTMENNKLSIKILSFYSAPEVRHAQVAEEGEAEIEQIQVFAELPFQVNTNQFEKTGLDVLFYGQ